MKRRWWPWIALALLAIPAIALARPGGGDSYSGGGGHGGGGGGGGYSGGGGGGGGGDGGAIFELIFQLIRLCIYYPQIGVPIIAIIFGYIIYGSYVRQKNKDWDSGPPVRLEKTVHDLSVLTRIDPDFSRILFEDFAFRLYAAAHRARGTGTLDELGPYLGRNARQALAARKPTGVPVSGVVIGAMRAYRVDVPSADEIAARPTLKARIGLEFEANYSVGAPGQQRKIFAVETWLLARSVAARTKPPMPARTFPCPNCGAPWQDADAGRSQKCAYCGEVVDNGRFDWQVEEIVLRHEKRGLPSLDQEVEERGTSLPTYRQDGVAAGLNALAAADPAVVPEAIIARLYYVYRVVNDAWTANDLGPARGVLSDGLTDYFQYWLDAYKSQGLRNVLIDMRILKHEVAKLTRDRYYDAITIRIWGTGKDYVERDGAHVRGSKRTDRKYSEYWTLIRSASRRGAPRVDGNCANCGAPLIVTMAGACQHCGVHVTSGEFDWVLSKIEQDDSYRG